MFNVIIWYSFYRRVRAQLPKMIQSFILMECIASASFITQKLFKKSSNYFLISCTPYN